MFGVGLIEVAVAAMVAVAVAATTQIDRVAFPSDRQDFASRLADAAASRRMAKAVGAGYSLSPGYLEVNAFDNKVAKNAVADLQDNLGAAPGHRYRFGRDHCRLIAAPCPDNVANGAEAPDVN